MTLNTDEIHVLNKMATGRSLFMRDQKYICFMGPYAPEEAVDFDLFVGLRMNHLIKTAQGSTPKFPVYEITEAGIKALKLERKENV